MNVTLIKVLPAKRQFSFEEKIARVDTSQLKRNKAPAPPLIITIPDQDAYDHLVEINKFTPSKASIQKLCTKICEDAYDDGVPELEIHVHRSLLTAAYHINPAMLSRSMNMKLPYAACQSWQKGRYVIVRAANHRKPLTFTQRCLAEATATGKFISLKKDIPASYLARPVVITRMLQAEFATRFAMIATEDKIEWRKI